MRTVVVTFADLPGEVLVEHRRERVLLPIVKNPALPWYIEWELTPAGQLSVRLVDSFGDQIGPAHVVRFGP